jgi:hypothetical protein
MRQTVIINDGELDQEIGTPYFFQDERISNLNKDQVTELYRHTAVKEMALRSADPNDQLNKVRQGLDILGQMVKDMHGDAKGLVIIHGIKRQIV